MKPEPRYTEHHFVFECGTRVWLRLPPNITSVQVHIAPVGGPVPPSPSGTVPSQGGR